MFRDVDVRQIEKEGLTREQVEAQIGLFKKGASPLKLARPCTVGDGMEALSQEELSRMVEVYHEEVKSGREILKFVPASGAASRMFKDWYVYLEKRDLSQGERDALARDLKRFAFYGDLASMVERKGERLEDMIVEGKYVDVLVYILTAKGLNYGSLPKALLKFHTYSDGSRAAIEEHLVEAAMYAKDACRICRLHFTLSDEHNDDIARYLSTVRAYYEKDYDVHFAISLSTQRPSTNTIAVDLDNRPFRDQKDALVFRPGGHGALLDNLNDACGDIVYLKNIDNVVPDRLKPATVLYKKVIGGYLISLQREIFRCLELLEKSEPDEKTMENILLFCRKRLHLHMKPGFENLTRSEKRSFVAERLNRPIRVCSMVKNEGDPGGGPFWVNEGDGTQSLQIVEESQIDSGSQEQKAIWSKSTHFNPVDLVCGVRDYRSKSFDLHQFVDKNAYFISQKSEKGRDLKALELPGLWNGSMAFWITVFVEVPIEIFNPVKTVFDLLRPQHLA